MEDCEKCVETGNPFFDHETLLWMTLEKFMEFPDPNIGWKPENPIKCLSLGRDFCTWPHNFDPTKTVITMGISDGESKDECLIELGVVNENERKCQLIGKVDALKNIYYDDPYPVLVSDFPGNYPHGNLMSIQIK